MKKTPLTHSKVGIHILEARAEHRLQEPHFYMVLTMYAGSVNYSNSPEISFYWDHSPHEAWLTMIPVRSQSLTVGVAVKTLPIVQWASTSSCDLLSQLQHLQHLPRLASGLVKVRRYKDQLASAQHTTKNMITFRRLCCVMNDRPRDQWGK